MDIGATGSYDGGHGFPPPSMRVQRAGISSMPDESEAGFGGTLSIERETCFGQIDRGNFGSACFGCRRTDCATAPAAQTAGMLLRREADIKQAWWQPLSAVNSGRGRDAAGRGRATERRDGDRESAPLQIPQKNSTTLKPARTGQISTFQLGQQFRSFGLGSGLSHDLASVHCLTLAFGRACRPIR